MNAGRANKRSSSVSVVFPSVSLCGNEKPRPSEGKTGAHATHAHNLHSFPRRYKGMRFWQVSWLMAVACPSPSHGLGHSGKRTGFHVQLRGSFRFERNSLFIP